jgi:purine-binding chemotaxis protein CheW
VIDEPASPARSEATALLRARALALARPLGTADTAPSIEVLEFRLANECYAVETRHVSEVLALGEMALLPGTPPFALGLVNVRGRITLVIDVKKFFDLPDRGLTDLHHVILVRGHGLEVGLLADVIVGVRSLALDGLQPSLATLSGLRADYLKGVSAERVVVLDVERMLADPKIIVQQEVGI